MTPTDLANKALRHLKIPSIDNIDDTADAKAVTMKTEYDDTRQLYLRLADPGFARREVALALSTGETSVKYDYVYGFPADSLKLREIWNGTTNNDPRIEYETGAHSSNNSTVILTNNVNAVMFYTEDVTNLNRFMPDDILAMSYLWAMNTTVLTRSETQANNLEVRFARALSVAKTNTRSDQHKAMPTYDEYIKARQ